jgi:hypothetical protein
MSQFDLLFGSFNKEKGLAYLAIFKGELLWLSGRVI